MDAAMFDAYDATGPSFSGEEDIAASYQSMSSFLKGQGLLPSGAVLPLLNASPEETKVHLDLLARLVSTIQQDNRARDELREQVDKHRVAQAAAERRNEALEANVQKLKLVIKDNESKLLAAKHKAEEQERDLQRKLQSTTTRLNDLLRGGRDAGKRGAAVGRGGGAVTGPGASAGGPRRVNAPSYDRFHDDLEAELAELQRQNARLEQQLAAARQQAKAAAPGGRSAAAGSPRGDGRWAGQSSAAPGRGPDGEDVASQNDRGPQETASPESVSQLARQRCRIRDLETDLEKLRYTNQELQGRCDKLSAERSENLRALHSLRCRCASLEHEVRKADDRALHAQRAAAPPADVTSLQGQLQELRRQLTAHKEELLVANGRVHELEQRLATTETGALANERHAGILARAMKAQRGGEDVLCRIGELVAEELRPLQEQLQQARSELAAAHAEHASMKVELDSARAAATSAPAPLIAASAGAVASPSSLQPPSPSGLLPLSPTGPLPSSPGPQFGGFDQGEPLLSDSPPKLQPPPAHAFYNRTFAATMPSPRSRPRAWSQPQGAPDGDYAQSQWNEEPQQLGAHGAQKLPVHGGAFPPPLPRSAGGAAVRRSMSAGMSAERQRQRWQVQSQSKARYPSPIDIIMEMARSSTADPTIDIKPDAAEPTAWADA